MNHDIHDEKLRAAVAALPREVPPERDLWPGIATRIAPPRRHARPWPIAAAVAGLIALGVIAAAFSLHHRPASASFAVQSPATGSHPLSSTPALDARARIIAATVRRSTQLDPPMQAVLLKNLGLVETSIADIQQAMQANPGAAGLQPLLYQQYRAEATIVTAAQRVQLQTTMGVIAP